MINPVTRVRGLCCPRNEVVQLELEVGLGFSAHTQTKLFHHTFVVGVNSNLGQPLSSKTKKWGWVRERAGYLGTTFALKEQYRPV